MEENVKKWMLNPETMGSEAVEMLPQLIEAHPYCSTYRLLYTIALANTHSTKFTTELQTTAIALPDRTKLFTLVNNGEYEWIKIMQLLANAKQTQTPTDDFALINQYLEQRHIHTAESQQATSIPEVIPAYDISALGNLAISINDDEEDIVLYDSNETDDTDDIINNFIEADNTGRLFVPKARKAEADLPVADPESIREKAFLTESLAKLYVKQHKFEQALAIFSSLNLKYSKKSSYFADQIRYLEKVIAYQQEKQAPKESKK